ncbi:MAG: flagellar protein FlgN [Pelagimonas sp.]|uniref:flagellar protein FlgN n=1 Tax=Pelagimonas sp. TaxID=2073170 RepID=UPI003D6C63E2
MTDVSLADQLDLLLQAEREALLAGDFVQIAELLEVKEALAGKLNDQEISSEELAPLQDGMRRNQELFDQALAGIRNVAARLGDLQRIRRSMDTYDAYGRRMTIDAPQEKKLERRA